MKISYGNIVNYFRKEIGIIENRGILQHPDEWNALVDIISKLNIQYGLEIGSFNGGSFYGLCQIAGEDATLISIDIGYGEYKNSKLKEDAFLKFKKQNQKIHIIEKDSYEKETFNIVENILKDRKLDYLFIDGNHNYEYVKNDFYTYSKFVKDGGIIVFHDINGFDCPGVKKIWEEIKSNYSYKEIKLHHQNSIYGLGIINFRNNLLSNNENNSEIFVDSWINKYIKRIGNYEQ